MQELSAIIIKLLQTEDCVVLPNFGGILKRPISASFDGDQHKISPPGIRLAFNARLKEDDGLLVQRVALDNKISYKEAVKVVANWVNSLISDLASKGAVRVEGVGRFLQSNEGKVEFRPEDRFASAAEGYGLSSLLLAPLPVESTIEIETEREEIISIAPDTMASKPNYWRYAAASLAIPFLGYVGWLAIDSNVFDENNRFHYSDLNPFSEKACLLYKPDYAKAFTSIVDVDVATFSIPDLKDEPNNFIRVKLLENETGFVVVKGKEEKVISAKAASNRNTSKSEAYNIIAGCFAQEQNANKLIQRLNANGYQASILDKKNGLYRVTAQQFDSYQKAKAALKEFKAAEISSAWIAK